MAPQLVSLKPKPTVPPTQKPPTNAESNPAYFDKASFPTIVRKDVLTVKNKATPEVGTDERKCESAPIHIHRELDFAQRTQRGYTARHIPSRT